MYQLNRVSLVWKIISLCFILGVISNLLFIRFVMPRRTVIAEYKFKNWDIEVIETKIRLIGDFPSIYVLAERNDELFSDDILLYETDKLSFDSLQIKYIKPDIILIRPYINDTIKSKMSCEYDLLDDIEPCVFRIGGTRVQH